MKLGELFFELGFHADSMKLKDFGKAVSELNMSSILTAGSFGAVYEGAKSLLEIADSTALGINKFGRETGQSTEEMQKWSKVAEQMGMSTGVVASSVGSLEDQITNMKITGEGSGIWNVLGIDPKNTNNMFQVIDSIRTKLKGLPTNLQRVLLERTPLGPEWLNMLTLSDQKWADIGKQLYLNNQQLSEADKYHQTMVQYSQNINKIWLDMGISLMPVAKSLMDIANSLDANILKSKNWKWYLDGIANTLEIIAHPIKSMQTLTGATGKKSDWESHPLFRMPWQHFNLDGTYATGNLNAADVIGSSKPPINQGPHGAINVQVKNTVYTSDPGTTIETTTEQGTLSNTVRNIVNQRSAGTT